MTRIAISSAITATLVLAAALPAFADDAPKSLCIPTYQIDHTRTPDDWTIQFFMINRKVYQAKMISQCVGLRVNTRGFTYEPTIPGANQICSNLMTIRLNDNGSVCLVGAITPVEPPPRG
jgi:hypothetical protein